MSNDLKKKRILIFTHEFPPRLGGAGSVALQLANYFNHKYYDVTLVTKKRKHDIKYNFKLIEVNTISRLWFLSYYIFFKFHDLKQYDYIILNDGGAIYSAGLAFSNENLNKSIIYVHGIEKYLDESSIFLKLLNFRKVYLKVFEKSKKIITVSNYIKDIFFKDDIKHFLPKVQTIYNSVDINQFYYVKSNILDNYNLNSKSIILLSVGRITKEKGYLEKLKIFEKLLKIDRSYVWFIIGDGDFKDDFFKIIKDKELTKNIILLGKKDKEELKYYYSQANFFWLLSNLDESFGLVYLEAMACKCIPIGWNRSGVKEVIRNNINGCLANNEKDVVSFIEKGYKNINKELLLSKILNLENPYTKVLD